ncbi:VOC family protein [Olsenella phocaeensis]|uniref:VOC family protein n=1 Tax=Olsenella phocaeensis TaxID=1852385 RepID=UPI003A8D09E9
MADEVKDTSVQDTSVKDTSVKDTSVKDTSVQDDPVALFGLSIAHVGVNAATDEEAEQIAGLFQTLMGLPRNVQAPISLFSGSLVEIMRPQAPRGEKGHIGFHVDDLPAAERWFEARGFRLNQASRVLRPDGSTQLIYFERQIAGFAIHLCS